MTEQTKALRLADALDRWHEGVFPEDAAAELRRLSAVEQQRDELLEAAKLVIAWFDAEDDHSKADFYQRIEMCRTSEAALRAAIAKVEGKV
jgi:hypothetical protein